MKIYLLVVLLLIGFIFAEPQPEDTPCDICKFVVSYSTHLLNQSRPEVLQFLTKGCEYLPDNAVQICKTFVKLYGNLLIDFIVEQGRRPQEFCKQIKLCNNIVEEPIPELTMKSDACDMCQFVIKQAVAVIDRNKDEIIKILVQQCEKLPKGPNQICKTFVMLYGKQLIEWIIEKGNNPYEFCSKIGLCSANHQMTIEEFGEQLIQQNGVACEICQFAVRAVTGYVNGSKDDILKFLNEQCEKLPNGLDKVCKTFVIIYGKQLIEWIVDKGNNPKEFCGYVGLCEKIQADPPCEMCKMGVSYVKMFLDSKSDEELLKFALDLCEKLPGNGAPICRAAVMLYGKELLKMAREKLKDPVALCTQLGLCKGVYITIPTDNKVKCIFDCLKGKVKLEDIIRAVFICKKDIKCYIKELKLDEAAIECVTKCLF